MEVSQRIQAYLVANGLRPTQDVGAADLILVDTCGFCQAAEDHSMSLLSMCVDGRHPGARVLVVGCLPGINPGRLATVSGVEVLTLAELGRLDEITGGAVPFHAVRADDAAHLTAQGPSPAGSSRRVFHVTTSTGCLHDCTYCAIKQVWGRLSSKPVATLRRELEVGLAAGHQMFYLAAQDLGAYGIDLGVSVVDLLESLFEVEGRYRLLLHDFNPQWLLKHRGELRELLPAHLDKIAYLDVPLQSGSDPVLARMKRPYKAARVLEEVLALKEAAPELIIELDVMMGFPGETDEDFALSAAFVEQTMALPQMCYWLSGFSPRPGTAAARMDDAVDSETVMQRFLGLRGLVERGPSELGTGLVYYPDYHL